MRDKRGDRFTSGHAEWQAGFSLIELLVILSIIGILSTISIVMLSGARGSGADAAIKADLKTIQTQAAVVFSNNDCYTDTTVVTPGSCSSVNFPANNCGVAPVRTVFREPKVAEALLHAGDASVNNGGIARASCVQAPSSGAWAISVPLKTNPLKSWCVDSNGAKREVTNAGDRGFNGTNCE